VYNPAVAGDPIAIVSIDNLLGQPPDLHAKTLRILDGAEQAGDIDQALRALARANKYLDLLAKISIILADRLKTDDGQDNRQVIFINLMSTKEDGTTLDMRVVLIDRFDE
jgi:hypothetical protein